jgi:hypothetical protein
MRRLMELVRHGRLDCGHSRRTLFTKSNYGSLQALR